MNAYIPIYRFASLHMCYLGTVFTIPEKDTDPSVSSCFPTTPSLCVLIFHETVHPVHYFRIEQSGFRHKPFGKRANRHFSVHFQ